MPVRKVTTASKMRVGMAFERPADIEVWTNGSLTQEALSSAANILVDLFNP